MSFHLSSIGGARKKSKNYLFQALRFGESHDIHEEILAEKNPMKAKWKAKARKEEMIVEPLSEEDLDNMRLVLKLKLDRHKDVQKKLRDTRQSQIVEDCSNRPGGSGLFWGAKLESGSVLTAGEWTGKNWLGRIWMELR